MGLTRTQALNLESSAESLARVARYYRDRLVRGEPDITDEFVRHVEAEAAAAAADAALAVRQTEGMATGKGRRMYVGLDRADRAGQTTGFDESHGFSDLERAEIEREETVFSFVRELEREREEERRRARQDAMLRGCVSCDRLGPKFKCRKHSDAR